MPKPIHGWRAFAGEVGIIVVGVLIALALESIADDLHWKSKVADARQELRYEVGHNLQLLDWRLNETACVDRRLDQLGAIVQQAANSGRLPPLGAVSAPSSGTWPVAVWQSQVSAQTTTHFPAGELASLGRVYRFIDYTHERDDRDTAAWRTLQTMAGQGRPVDPATIQSLTQALVTARLANRGYALSKKSIVRVLSQGRLGEGFPQIDPHNPPVNATVGPDPICEPIGRSAANPGAI